ncbi:DUF305 domain-containing protein [Tessaracoccus flavus]|uniref:DUF305 domain-containing protein n=2 Tax=Tessaracoccus flavus TaxID=1610493 RepID=A0A1Q2CIW9_9ACTN|nr:DUF305 domain-containing protein [Tessaracoccus flavus]
MSMYWKFGGILLVNLFLMWALSMSMVRSIDHFYFNPSNLYMAVLMVAAMAVLMTVGMWSMLKNRTLNIILLVGFLALFLAAFFMGRSEVGVGDEGFLKSMIPHHSRAILVCQEASITDPEIEQLCVEIIDAQQKEIAQMKEILERYE